MRKRIYENSFSIGKSICDRRNGSGGTSELGVVSRSNCVQQIRVGSGTTEPVSEGLRESVCCVSVGLGCWPIVSRTISRQKLETQPTFVTAPSSFTRQMKPPEIPSMVRLALNVPACGAWFAGVE